MLNIRVLIFFSIFMLIGSGPVTAYDELGSKPEMSFLQSAEFQTRKELIDKGTYIVRESKDFQVLGLRDSEKNQNVWIVLNPKAAPFIKVLPNEYKISVSPKEYVDITSSYDVILPVRKFLADHTIF